MLDIRLRAIMELYNPTKVTKDLIPYDSEGNVIETSNDLIENKIEEITARDAYNEVERYFVKRIDDFINVELQRLNNTRGITISNMDRVGIYSTTEGSEFKEDCKELWDWQTNLWATLREWKDSLTALPTEDDLTAILEENKFIKTYE